MLNVALIGLLAGSLTLGAPDGDDKDKKKNQGGDPPVAEDNRTPGVFETAEAAEGPETITQDTYAFGVPSDVAPIKFWASYGMGEADVIWDVDGSEGELTVAGSQGDILTQRINVGAQVNFLNLPAFKVGAGGQLTVSQNEFRVADTPNSPFINGVGDIESGFGLQGLKVYGTARGHVAGVHGGYIFDFGNPREFGEQARANIPGFGEQALSINAAGDIQPTALVAGNASYQQLLLPTSLSNSDQRDAIFFGADFDYPSDRFRLFGGIDYYMLQQTEDEAATAFDESTEDDDDLLNFLFGAGVKFSVVEIGAALQIQTRFANPIVKDVGTTAGTSSHAGTVAPYLRISPPSLPASIFIKGALQEEYTEFGYPIGGSNSPTPSLGFTAGITLGFE